MIYRLYRLRHYTVVGSNYQYGNVRYLCASCTHCCKRFMAGCVEERYIPVSQTYTVSAYVLGNATRFSGSNARITDSIQKRCLTVVNVTHNNNYRRTRNQIFRLILKLKLLKEKILFRLDYLLVDGDAELQTDKLCGIEIYRLIHRRHNAEHHQLLYNLSSRLAHLLRKLRYGYCIGYFYFRYNDRLRFYLLLFFTFNILLSVFDVFLLLLTLLFSVFLTAALISVIIRRNHLFYTLSLFDFIYLYGRCSRINVTFSFACVYNYGF